MNWDYLVNEVVAARPNAQGSLRSLCQDQVRKLSDDEKSALITDSLHQRTQGRLRAKALEDPGQMQLPGIDAPLREICRVERGEVDWLSTRFVTPHEARDYETWLIRQWIARARDAEERVPKIDRLIAEVENSGYDPDSVLIDEYRFRDQTCAICTTETNPGRWSIDDPFEIDHIQPVEWGGENDDPNLRIVHRSCNRRKGDRH